jgi:hypothetical protein
MRTPGHTAEDITTLARTDHAHSVWRFREGHAPTRQNERSFWCAFDGQPVDRDRRAYRRLAWVPLRMYGDEVAPPGVHASSGLSAWPVVAGQVEGRWLAGVLPGGPGDIQGEPRGEVPAGAGPLPRGFPPNHPIASPPRINTRARSVSN